MTTLCPDARVARPTTRGRGASQPCLRGARRTPLGWFVVDVDAAGRVVAAWLSLDAPAWLDADVIPFAGVSGDTAGDEVITLHAAAGIAEHPPAGERPGGAPPPGAPLVACRAALEQCAQYALGHRRVFNLPLATAGTPFQLAAWRALCAIPFGQRRTYAQQAAALGSPRAHRAVGGANSRNRIAVIIPCHRVVSSTGLGGYSGGLEIKRRLLDHEARWASADARAGEEA